MIDIKFCLVSVLFFASVIDAQIPITNQRYRQFYHIMTPGGWMNDPNGLSFFNGQYHVFYQYNPDAAVWGPMHWGHVTSTDLVHWKNQPIALYPDQWYDAQGCFSGSAIVQNNQLVLIYTGNLNNPNKQIQNMAYSSDGINFQKFSGNPIVGAPPSDGTMDFRDPKVWQNEGSYYMVVGNKDANQHARVVLYKSADLKAWSYVGPMAAINDTSIGFMWECPNFYSIGGKDILMMSPQGMERDGDRFANLFQTGYFIGNYDYAANHFNHGDFYEVDLGHDFYAAQMFVDATGRNILIGWLDIWGADFYEQADGWSGTMTIPRVLGLNADQTRLTMTPIPELTSLRGPLLENTTTWVYDDYNTKVYLNATELFVSINLKSSQAKKVGIKFPLNDGNFEVFFDLKIQKLVSSRKKDIRQVYLGNIQELNLHIFVDRSSIEVFTTDGLVTMSSRFYVDYVPQLSLFSYYGLSQISLEAYPLSNIW